MNSSGKPESHHPTSFGTLFLGWTVLLAILFTLGIWLPMLIFLDDGAGGIGVGAFTAVWGAPGFGAMIAGAQWADAAAIGHDGHERPTDQFV